MISSEKPQPIFHDSLTVQKSASIFRDTLYSILAEDSPFADAPFMVAVAEKYLEDKNQQRYFTAEEGLGANVVVRNGVADPEINLNIQEGLRSRNLRKRVAIRLGKESCSDEEIFQFAVGHELGHLIQGIADFVSIEDQNTYGLTETQLDQLKLQIKEYNEGVRTNKDVQNAQEVFRSIFKGDIVRNNEQCIDAGAYTDEEYLTYVNSEAEANADFISLWIIGMSNPSVKTAPQNEGYQLDDWKKWANDHKISMTHIA